MRLGAVMLTLVCTVAGWAGDGGVARADERRPGPDVAPPADPPRWRLRAMLAQGFGGSDGVTGVVTRFPTTLELGARVWGPLSVDAGVTATVAGEYATACG